MLTLLSSNPSGGYMVNLAGWGRGVMGLEGGGAFVLSGFLGLGFGDGAGTENDK